MKVIYREKKKTENGIIKEIYSVNTIYYEKNEIVKFEDKIKNKIFYLKVKEETELETCDKCFFCKYRITENTFCNIRCYRLKNYSSYSSLKFEEIPMFKILFGKEFKNDKNSGNKKNK